MSGDRPWQSVMDTAADMNNPVYRKALEQRQALEGSYPEMVVAPLARAIGQSVKSALPAARDIFQTVERKEWPTVFNHVAGAEKVLPAGSPVSKLRGRPFTESDKVTYGYRNLSQGELDDLAKTGYLNPNPAAAFSKDGKWLSAGDETGIFGRVWKDAPSNSTIRVPIGSIPKTKAISAKDVELLDKKTKSFGPLSKKE